MTVKGAQCLDDGIHIIRPRGTVDTLNVVGRHGVEFEYVVVNLEQGGVHLGAHGHGSIAQHAHFGCREVAVAQSHRIVNNACKIGVRCRFAITGKGQHIGGKPVLLHFDKLRFEGFGHLLAAGAWQMRTVVFVETALAVHTIKGADLAIGGHKVDA